VKLKADHGQVCKFGESEGDQDNLELVLGNLRDIYEDAIRQSESTVIYSDAGMERGISTNDDVLRVRFAEL
jgi:hypothetical protein